MRYAAASALIVSSASSAETSLRDLQQRFLDMRFGMFIHFNIPTFMNQDWADPDAPALLFDPARLDCDQWAGAAASAKMSYGCLTTKHHSGFCIWDTKTTDYDVMASPLTRDVVKEYVDAFRRKGLKPLLYYSILDTHHRLRPGRITAAHVRLIKDQLTELLTNYGEIPAIILDGWDAPWSRISYEDIPFEEIYRHIKSLQPNCLVMDLNSAKYPAEALFYTDIKSYEQNAGQHISKENRLPALSCLPINASWFWKTSFPNEPVKSAEELVNANLVPMNEACCTFLLNVAPNREGLIDENVCAELKKIGALWRSPGDMPTLPQAAAPLISRNLAKFRPSESSWSHDMWIMDFGNDDDFDTAWQSSVSVSEPWYEVELEPGTIIDAMSLVEPSEAIERYRLEAQSDGKWTTVFSGRSEGRVNIRRFEPVKADRVRLTIDQSKQPPAIAELAVYHEGR